MSEADLLLAALDAAHCDTERDALLARCSPEQLEQLNAALIYRQFCAEGDAQLTALASFTRELDQAADDAARLAVIERARLDPARGPAWLGEWGWRRTATVHDWHARYTAILRREGTP